MAGVTLFGWDGTNKVWLPVLVDASGNLKVDFSAINLDDLADVYVPSPTDAYVLTWDTATSKWIASAPSSAYTFYIASDVLLLANDTERSIYKTAYYKLKESRVGGGALRIAFDLKAQYPVEDNVYAKIYRNGVAVGTERITTSATYVTFSEDLSGWLPGDLCQVYVHGTAYSQLAYVRNFRIYGTGEDMWKATSGY